MKQAPLSLPVPAVSCSSIWLNPKTCVCLSGSFHRDPCPEGPIAAAWMDALGSFSWPGTIPARRAGGRASGFAPLSRPRAPDQESFGPCRGCSEQARARKSCCRLHVGVSVVVLASCYVTRVALNSFLSA